MSAARPVSAVPWPVRLALLAALAAHIGWSATRRAPAVEVQALPPPPPAALLQVAAFGEPRVLARVLMLWLQAFDYQPGVSLAFADLDYARVVAWLERMLALDPGFQYPLLAAARLYGEVDDPARQRLMLDFVRREFAADPVRRWPWMAHAVYLARHRLHDPELALALARELAAVPADSGIPSWARQMHIFVLEDMGELESARILLGGLLESGEISDPHERRFLSQRLHELEQRAAEP